MQRYNAAAISTHPFFSFFTQILLCSNGLESHGIVDQACLIPLPIAFVKALDYRAGEGRAVNTKVKALPQRASSYFALAAMFRLGIILPPASQARLFLLQVHIAHPAIHSAESQHCCRYFSSHFAFDSALTPPVQQGAPIGKAQRQKCAQRQEKEVIQKQKHRHPPGRATHRPQ